MLDQLRLVVSVVFNLVLFSTPLAPNTHTQSRSSEEASYKTKVSR